VAQRSFILDERPAQRRSAAMNVVQLSPVDLAIASLLILALAGLSWRMQIGANDNCCFPRCAAPFSCS
jgi:hypothetical protein